MDENKNEDNTYDEDAKNFAKEVIEAKKENIDAEIDYDDKIINSLTNICSKKIFEYIRNEKNISSFDINQHFGSNLTFSGEILELFDKSLYTHLIIKNEQNANNYAQGKKCN